MSRAVENTFGEMLVLSCEVPCTHARVFEFHSLYDKYQREILIKGFTWDDLPLLKISSGSNVIIGRNRMK